MEGSPNPTNVRSIEAPVGNPNSSPARPSGLQGLKTHAEEQPGHSKWFAFWKYNFCIRENANFGTWEGVFPTCLAHLLNVIVFLRTGKIVVHWVQMILRNPLDPSTTVLRNITNVHTVLMAWTALVPRLYYGQNSVDPTHPNTAEAGVLLSISISILCIGFAGVTVLSAVGILRRSSVECRDIYQILAVTLGTRASSCVGLLYAFTHAISCSLHVMGMGELIVGIYYENYSNDHDWAVRGVACGCLFLLTFFNAFGVRWIIRAQYLIVILLALGVGDFVIGAFFRRDPKHGIEGPSTAILHENLHSAFSSWHDYFYSLGIFFPSTVGVLVGFNIASDLRDPHRSIPKGTFTALICSFGVHLTFILLLGMSVYRSYLLKHPHTAIRMAAIQIFIISAIFVSSFSGGLGALFNASRILSEIGILLVTLVWVNGNEYGKFEQRVWWRICSTLRWLLDFKRKNIPDIDEKPTVVSTSECLKNRGLSPPHNRDQWKKRQKFMLQRVTKDTGIPILRRLNWEWQRYNTPLFSILVIFLMAFLFILIGRIDFLAPIITTSHFLTFATINYAYFALSTTYKIQTNREHQATTEWLQQGLRERRIASPESRSPKARSPEAYGTLSHSSSVTSERSHLLGGGSLITTPKEPLIPMKAASPVLSKPEDWYLKLHNRWAALVSAIIMVILAFIIQWESALSTTSFLGLLYITIHFVSPKAAAGIVEFHPIDWLRSKISGDPSTNARVESFEPSSVTLHDDSSTTKTPSPRTPGETDKPSFLTR